MLDKLNEYEQRYEELSALMADLATSQNPAQYQKLAREMGDLQEVVDLAGQYRAVLEQLAEAEEIIADGSDAELVELATTERDQLRVKVVQLEETLKVLLIPKDPNDGRNAIVEIRAGTGGDEAGLFASDLYRMYHRFAERKGLKTEELSSSQNPAGGFKEVVFVVSGADAFGQLKFESGIHRVQRVPKTEGVGPDSHIGGFSSGFAGSRGGGGGNRSRRFENRSVPLQRAWRPERQYHGFGRENHPCPNGYCRLLSRREISAKE